MTGARRRGSPLAKLSPKPVDMTVTTGGVCQNLIKL